MDEAIPEPVQAGDVDPKTQWASHLESHDFETARRLLKRQDYDLVQANYHEEGARYEAEKEFFDCQGNREEVEELLGRIVDERYRGTHYDDSRNIIDLRNISARRYIAAERLFQQKLKTLGGIDAEGKVELGLGGEGPREKYHVHAGDDFCPIELQQRSRQGQGAVRVGDKFVHYVPAYRDKDDEEGIVTALENYLEDLTGDRQRFVRSLQQMCAQHIVLCEVLQGYDFKKRNKLLQIMFHILDNEPSQFQSACFTSGDAFKFGMTVSFARLVKLFLDKHINLKQIFLEACDYESGRNGWNNPMPVMELNGRCYRCVREHYALYSTIGVLKKMGKIRRTCQKIDVMYSKGYGVTLNKAQAIKDLEFLYGTSR